jgi:hypothetical protein
MAAEMRCELSHCTPASRAALVASRGSVSPVIVDTASTLAFQLRSVRQCGTKVARALCVRNVTSDQHHSGS